jgi:hypothetical protein
MRVTEHKVHSGDGGGADLSENNETNPCNPSFHEEIKKRLSIGAICIRQENTSVF